jgi:hypothetical protein
MIDLPNLPPFDLADMGRSGGLFNEKTMRDYGKRCYAAGVADERERAAKIAERAFGGKAHTYASENADRYRVQDEACEHIATMIRKG